MTPHEKLQDALNAVSAAIALIGNPAPPSNTTAEEVDTAITYVASACGNIASAIQDLHPAPPGD